MSSERRFLFLAAVLVIVGGLAVALLLPSLPRPPVSVADCDRTPRWCDDRLGLRLAVGASGLVLGTLLIGLGLRGGRRTVWIPEALALLVLGGGLLGWGLLTVPVASQGLDPIVEPGPSLAGIVTFVIGLAVFGLLTLATERARQRDRRQLAG